METERVFKLNLCLTAVLAAVAMTPAESFAKSKKTQSHVNALEDENAELRKQVEELQAKLRETQDNTAKQSPAQAANPFAAKEVGKSAAAAAVSQNKTKGEMACGAQIMNMEPGSQFYFNPVWGGLDMFHTHPKGMWMANVKWMHSQDNDLMAGTTPVNPNQVYTGQKGGVPSKYSYMMPGTGQTMDMFMFMPMYGVTDDLTLMAMINYQYMSMPMVMNMGMNMGFMTEGMAPMDSGGLADTQVDAIYKIGQWGQHGLTGTMGLNIPTGSTSQQTSNMMGGDNAPAQILSPYDMQNGQGTVNLMPALTYQWLSEDALWNLGGQASGVYHIGTNNGYSMGDSVTFSAWGQRAFGDATTWLRAKYTNTAQIYGSNPDMDKSAYMGDGRWLMPDYNPQNYGGDVLNMLVGGSYQYHGYSVGLEGGIPVYQDLNGLQLRNSWYLNAGFQAMF